MCTVAVLLSADGLLIAANRDESPSRPARPPRLWSDGPIPFVAGEDVPGGGTWLGVSAAGLSVALTNLWWGDFRQPRPRSRGAVVTALLSQAPTLDAAQALLREQPRAELGPFNAIVCDQSGAGFVISAAAELLEYTPLAPGLHVISNLLPGADWDKTRRVQADLRAVLATTSDPRRRAALALAMARHTAGGEPRESVCVHTDHDYGTVSSALVWVRPDGAGWWYADGPPCRTPLQDYSSLLSALLRHQPGPQRPPPQP